MKPYIVALACLLSAVVIHAQTSQNKTTVKPSLLYKISGKGLTKPSYLFGTFHLACKQDFEITPSFKQYLSKSEQLYVELDITDTANLLPLMQLMQSNKGVSTYFSASDYKVLSDSFTKYTGYPIAVFENYKSIVLTSMLLQKLINCPNGISQIDSEIIKEAKKNNKPVWSLETAKQQMDALDKMPDTTSFADILSMVKNMDSCSTELKKMLAIYKKRDPNALLNSMLSSSNNNNNKVLFQQHLLKERNITWLPIIEKAIKQKASFFAFGAGHLANNYGVVRLLQQKGYTVTPVSY